MINIIVAYDEERAIGKDGKIPWHLPEDLKHFKETTGKYPVIMGRKTWDSLPPKFKPLPGRTNVVITRQEHEIPLFRDPSQPNWVNSIEEAIYLLSEYFGSTYDSYIIGGGQIYQEALEKGLVDRVIASEVKGTHDGDTFFPEITGWSSVNKKSFSGFDVIEYCR